MEVNITIRENGDIILDKSIIDVLEKTIENKSLHRSCIFFRYSYVGVLAKIKLASPVFGALVKSHPGIGSKVTDRGKQLIEQYRELEAITAKEIVSGHV